MAGRKSTAVTKRNGSKAVANLDEELRREVEGIQERIGSPESRRIKTEDKVFTFPTGQVLQGPLDFIILDFINVNSYFDRPYDPKNPAAPACFAIGRGIKGLQPVDESPDKQSSDCDSCWANEFGSGVGSGKACANRRRLVVMSADDDPEEGEIFTLEVSPTGLKKFDAYVGTVAKLFSKPPIAVVTKVDFHPEANYPTLIFSEPRPNPSTHLHITRRQEAATLLEARPDFSIGNEKQAKPARGGNRRRAAGGRR